MNKTPENKNNTNQTKSSPKIFYKLYKPEEESVDLQKLNNQNNNIKTISNLTS